MSIIQDSAAHHFLTFLNRIQHDQHDWHGLRISYAHMLDHRALIRTPAHIPGHLHDLLGESKSCFEKLCDMAKVFPGAQLYHFTDGDILLLADIKKEKDSVLFHRLYETMRREYGNICYLDRLKENIHACQAFAEDKLIGDSKIAAYRAMSETHKVASISLRRERRDDPLVLIIEDDRFTASYAANILNRDYDIVLAKTGEEGIMLYITHAPDIVLLDIHLPGLSGHETLQAIRQIDPHSFILMMSVDTAKDNIVKAGHYGASGFLKKPFSKARLLGEVEKSPFMGRFRH